MKYQGDLEIVKANWVGLGRFMDNEIGRATAEGIEKMFSNFGDWVPPPGSNGIEVPGGAEVSFQWKNPDLLLRNVDFLLKNG